MKYHKVQRKTASLESQLVTVQEKCAEVEKSNAKIRRVLVSTLHEVRRFSNELSSYAERLNKGLADAKADAELRDLCETIFYTSGMISSRLAFTDLELNPASVSLQGHFRSGIYKKFEKALHVLALKARLRHVTVSMRGQLFREIEALPAFELVPFVLLDNAIKYSPPYQDVVVRFEESAKTGRFEVVITNVGPCLEPGEATRVLESGERGQNAIASGTAGDGLGLYLATFLCNYHGLGLTVASDSFGKYDFQGTPFAPFVVRISNDIE
jgi:K+-sensing histidine kinase KdpD